MSNTTIIDTRNSTLFLTTKGVHALLDAAPQVLLEHVGRVLYGGEWQRAMADAMGFNPRSVRRWAAGDRSIPPDLWPRLSAALVERSAEARALAKRLPKA